MIHGLDFEVQSDLFTPEEQLVANKLGQRLASSRTYLTKHLEYYEGTQTIKHMGIAVPEQLQAFRSVVGWPRLAVDVMDESLDVQGFLMPGSVDADDSMWDIWCANGMESESQLAHLDALIYGRAFVIVGTSEDTPGVPLITVESPLNMAADFDARSKKTVAALQTYQYMGQDCVALYTKDSTIHLTRPAQGGAWTLMSRDNHNLGQCPVVMLTNRQRSDDRYGQSEITAEVMSLNDAACRTVLAMEIAREFFAAQQRWIMGASEENFVNADGTPSQAWNTYIGRILAIERDEEGNLPEVGTFTAQDPTPFTAVLQDLSKRFAAVTGLPPHMVGYSADNPASAEGINAADARKNKRAKRKQASFGPDWRDVMVLSLKVAGKPVPEDAHLLKTLWCPAETPTPLETSQAIQAQIVAGYLPATSDLAGERLGYSPVERTRIEQDRKREEGQAALAAIAQRGSQVDPNQPGAPSAQGAAPQGAGAPAQGSYS